MANLFIVEGEKKKNEKSISAIDKYLLYRYFRYI
jgi:hypothetical protein